MGSLGVETLDQTGRAVMVSADGFPEYKTRGVTIDWDDVPAVSGDTTLADDTVVKDGDKYMRFGQVITRKGTAEVQTYTLTGGPTAGEGTLTFPDDGFNGVETVSILFDDTAAEVQAKLEALSRFGVGRVAVSRTGAGSAGSPYAYAATYDRRLGNVDTPTATHTFTGGTTPSLGIVITTPGTGSGKFGPYDSAAADGRQTLSRGDAFVLNKTVLESEPLSDHPGAMEGGLWFKERILATNAAHSLAAGPTFTELETVFPRMRYAE